MPSMTLELGPETARHKRIMTKLQGLLEMGEKEQSRKHERWRKAEEAVLAYIPETAADGVRQGRRDDGIPQYTTIVVPYTYGVVMTLHTYLTSVFLGRSPVHQYMGRHGETEQQTQALEALIASQVVGGGLLGAYYIWLYDAIKYGVGIVGEYWEDETLQFSRIEERPNPDGTTSRVQTTRRVPGYQGNRVENISPFNFIPDPRVPAGEFQKGEFVAIKKEIGWNTLVRRARQGYYNDNINKIQSTPTWHGSSDTGTSSSALERPNQYVLQDEGVDGTKRKHPALVRVYEVYVDLIPSEWGLGGTDFPEKWVFTVTSDKRLLIGAQPHGAIHGQFPFGVLEPEIEAYGAWNRGTPETVEGIQQTMDWLLNSHFWNVRQTMNNQFIVDPSRVHMKDVAKGGPGFVWRARPEAYGTDLRQAIHQVPVADVTQAHIADLQNVFGIGERTIGVNETMMGATRQPTGRPTATGQRMEAGFATNRAKTIAEWMSARGFQSHSHRLVMNSQQYFSTPQKLRRVGDLVLEAGPNFVQVDPETIAGRYDFVPVDGTLPADRFAQATLWKDIFAQIYRIPAIAQQYDLGRIFAWVAQLVGLKNINQFKIQMGDPAQLAAAADAGNLVPAPGRGSPSSTQAGIPQAQGTVGGY